MAQVNDTGTSHLGREGALELKRGRRWRRYGFLVEWAVILLVAVLYSGGALLDFDASQLQQTGEHNESATLPLLADVSLRRYGEIPLWNPYMMTGFPHAGDLINHFWNPIATLPVLLFGGINGMKVSVFLALLIAGLGQWWFGHVFGLRGAVRLWSALLFMVSGGLALLWRVGWYELLLGIAWFPWCFASLWWALRRKDRSSLALTAVLVAMVLTTGGGYYPFYLLVSLGTLVGMALIYARPGSRIRTLGRAVAIAGLSAGLTAVMLLPILDGARYVVRDAGRDLAQRASQPIPYALINYFVSEPAWSETEILGSARGYNWFYIGALPLSALLFTAVAVSKQRWRRKAMISIAVLLLVLLAWHANRYTPVKYIYDAIPFLYSLRFPNRLLILAASPLIVLAGFGLQYLFLVARRLGRGWGLTLASRNPDRAGHFGLPLDWALGAILFLILALSVRNAFEVNKGFVFAPRPMNAKAYSALSWLKEQDPGLYYTDLGGGGVFWDWTPAAYELEMPIINFIYGRRLNTFDQQRQATSLFVAEAKYLFRRVDQPPPPSAELLTEFDGIGLWRAAEVLPFAFSAPPEDLQATADPNLSDVTALSARLEGPNRVVVRGEPTRPGDQLVVLVSDYPGWHLAVDGRQSPILAVNYYLGADLLPGEHTYEFVFRPAKHVIGLVISLLTLVVLAVMVASDTSWWARQVRSRLRMRNGYGKRGVQAETSNG